MLMAHPGVVDSGRCSRVVFHQMTQVFRIVGRELQIKWKSTQKSELSNEHPSSEGN